jgi:hypothetical protein
MSRNLTGRCAVEHLIRQMRKPSALESDPPRKWHRLFLEEPLNIPGIPLNAVRLIRKSDSRSIITMLGHFLLPTKKKYVAVETK